MNAAIARQIDLEIEKRQRGIEFEQREIKKLEDARAVVSRGRSLVPLIIAMVSDDQRVKVAQLVSRDRTQHIAFCRQLAMYLCRKLTVESYPAIGTHFNRDHSTVIHAYNLIAGRMATEPSFGSRVQKLERAITEAQLITLDAVPAEPPPAEAIAS